MAVDTTPFERGYTLFELLLVCTLFALLSRSAIATFPLLAQGIDRNSARQELESDLHRARSEALAKGIRVILEISAGGNSYTVGRDEYPFSATLEADETMFTRVLPTGYTISSSDILTFSSDGYLIDASGNLVNATVSILENGESILDATIYPIGGLEYTS